MSVKKEMTRNSIVGVIQLILTSILTFVAIPVFIRHLGLELYGIFALISVIGNLNTLSNFGLNRALMVYISKQGKCVESDRDIVVTFFWAATIMAIMTTIVICFRSFIITDILHVPLEYVFDGGVLLICLMLANSILFIGQNYTAILDSRQKIRITNVIQFIYSLIYWIGLITVVLLGEKLIALGFVALAASCIWFILLSIYAKKEWGAYGPLDLKQHFVAISKKLFSYGAKIYCASWLIFLYEPLSKILLSNFCGVNIVALYEIALKIKGVLNSLTVKAFYPLTPYLASCEESLFLHRRLWSISKLLATASNIIAAGIMLCMPYLLKIWLGSEYSVSVMIYVIGISVTYILFSPPSMPIFTYQSMRNMVGANIVALSASIVVNLLLFYLLFKFTPNYAIVISNGAGIFASYVICMCYQFKYGKFKFHKEFWFYIKQIGFVATFVFLGLFFYEHCYPNLINTIMYLLLISIYFIIFNKLFKMINREDIAILFSKESKVYKLVTSII